MLTPGLLVLALSSVVTAAPTTVLILPLEAKEGVTRDAADQLAAALAAHASTTPGLRVATYKEVESTLSTEQVRQVAGCGSASCAAEIAGALNTNAIVMGSFGRFGADYLLTLSLVNAKDAVVASRSVRRFPGARMEAVLDAIPAVVAELFAGMAQPAAPAAENGNAPPPQPVTTENTDTKETPNPKDGGAPRTTGQEKAVGFALGSMATSWMFRAAAGVGATAFGLGCIGASMCVGGPLLAAVGFFTSSGSVGSSGASGSATAFLIPIGIFVTFLSFFPCVGSGVTAATAAVMWGLARYFGKAVTGSEEDPDD